MTVFLKCILQLYFANVFGKCNCIFQMYFVTVFFKCILQLYFRIVKYGEYNRDGRRVGDMQQICRRICQCQTLIILLLIIFLIVFAIITIIFTIILIITIIMVIIRHSFYFYSFSLSIITERTSCNIGLKVCQMCQSPAHTNHKRLSFIRKCMS